MTKISLYPNDTNIQDDDILIGTDKETPGDETKNFSVGDLRAYMNNSLVFKSLATIPLSASDLNLAYPNAALGTRVICPSLEGLAYSTLVYLYTNVGVDSWALDIITKTI